MNWTIIGLLITLIVILFGSISIAAYSILRLVDSGKRLSYYLNYYELLSNKYRLQLTRIGEIVEEFDPIHWSESDVMKLVSNIKTLTKLAGKK
ncbi:hypothetical protein LCGC14_1578460 [marine sediment metagenome]|uniref:Uncharacterized protein n=1 Tax=marine sediment metagenome TaxID=412755 RepID=A0A0F9J3P6_9ZZZZ